MASRFTAEAFDDALDEDDLDHGDYGGGGGADDDEEEASNAVYTNGKHHVIEMRTLDKGQLSLEEVNG